MGIRSMLRKVFGRDREESPATSVVPPQTRETTSTGTSAASPSETVTAEATVAASAAATVPARSTASSGSGSSDTSEAVARQAADELVAASFDNPQIPRARAKTPSATPEKPAAEAEAPVAAAAAAAEEAPAAEAKVTAEAEAAPVEADKVDVEPTDAAEPEAEPSLAADTAEEQDTEPEPEAAVVADDTTPAAEAAEEPQADEPAASAEAEPEADTAEEPETAPVAEATDVVADAPAAEAEPAPQEQDTEPEAVAVADDTTPDAEAAEEPQADEPVAAADAEPEATAAEPAPQEQDTEPEAVAAEARADEPVVAEAPAPEPELTATEPEASGDGLPPHLADAHAAAAAQLKAQGLTGSKAAVYLVVDRSGSMRGYFKDGSVQRLAEQVTALAAHLDEDATVTTVFFSTDIDGTVDLTPADLTPTRIDEVNATLGRLGRTNYHRAVEEVLAHHEKADPTRTALVVFQTDGAPESKTAATQALAEAAERPLHWRFVVWGEEDNKAFDFVRKLDGTPRTATYFAGTAPAETAHAAFYGGLLAGLEF
ncbi:VWA domain-containing protein [Streptomyces sp. NPDC001930]|uniref:VWA domain-containing protein n=1 Tax=Streptomyces sp. NPDC001930 TaxID=3364625 RepID=UPI0036ADB4EE